MLQLTDEMVADLRNVVFPKYPNWEKRLSLLKDYRFGFIKRGDMRYDRIQRNRVLFEVNDNNGNVVGLCGRSVDGAEPKYLHPTGYKKGYTLFNIGRVFESAAGNRRVVVVEGNFDAMTSTTLWKPTVAIEGVQLTDVQARNLTLFKDGVTLALDRDDAGKLATIIATAKLKALGIKVLHADWHNECKDLDEYLRVHQEEPSVAEMTPDVLLHLYRSVTDYTKYSFVRDAYLALVKVVGAARVMRENVYVPPKPKAGTGTRYSDYVKFR